MISNKGIRPMSRVNTEDRHEGSATHRLWDAMPKSVRATFTFLIVSLLLAGPIATANTDTQVHSGDVPIAVPAPMEPTYMDGSSGDIGTPEPNRVAEGIQVSPEAIPGPNASSPSEESSVRPHGTQTPDAP